MFFLKSIDLQGKKIWSDLYFSDMFIIMMNSPIFQITHFNADHLVLVLESGSKESDSKQGSGGGRGEIFVIVVVTMTKAIHWYAVGRGQHAQTGTA